MRAGFKSTASKASEDFVNDRARDKRARLEEGDTKMRANA